jgi:tetratricopeptide (TPR) repeat protein
MHNLAAAYKHSGQLARAVPLYEETLQKRKATLGTDHPDTLSSMNNLAEAYQADGQLARAVPLHEETLQKRKARLGPEHPQTLMSMNNLARAYWAGGQLARAVPLLEETLQKRKAKLGPNHPDTLGTMGNLGKAYAETKQGAKAATTLIAFVDGSRKRAPKDSPRFAGLLVRVSLDLLGCGQHAAAGPLLHECLTICEKTQPDHWTTFNTMSLLGGALLGQKNYQGAELLLLKGYEGMKKREKSIPPQGKLRLPEALDRLIGLYTATNKPDELKKWQAERASYPGARPMPHEKK